ncbi:hypothetical protein JNK62_04605 [bacterium]|nr:hypothetical protein [bacterium]
MSTQYDVTTNSAFCTGSGIAGSDVSVGASSKCSLQGDSPEWPATGSNSGSVSLRASNSPASTAYQPLMLRRTTALAPIANLV